MGACARWQDELRAGTVFGEMALLREDGVRMANVIANEPTHVRVLTRETLLSLVGDLNAILEREAEKRQKEVDELTAAAANPLCAAHTASLPPRLEAARRP